MFFGLPWKFASINLTWRWEMHKISHIGPWRSAYNSEKQIFNLCEWPHPLPLYRTTYLPFSFQRHTPPRGWWLLSVGWEFAHKGYAWNEPLTWQRVAPGLLLQDKAMTMATNEKNDGSTLFFGASNLIYPGRRISEARLIPIYPYAFACEHSEANYWDRLLL